MHNCFHSLIIRVDYATFPVGSSTRSCSIVTETRVAEQHPGNIVSLYLRSLL